MDRRFLYTAPSPLPWEYIDTHYDAYLYLLRTGDPDAKQIGLRLLASAIGLPSSDVDTSEVGRSIVDANGYPVLWNYVAPLSVAQQVRILRYFDHVVPADWDSERDEFVARRPNLASEYDRQ